MKILTLLTVLLSLTASAAEPAQVLDSTAFVVEEAFFDAERGRAIAAALRAKKLDATLAGPALAKAVTDALWSIEDDGHLNVKFNEAKATEPLLSRDELRARLDAPQVPKKSAGPVAVVSSRMLDGGVGYIEVPTFQPTPAAQDQLADAMKVIEGASSVIVDLRKNGGGSQHLVDFLASYFFPADGRELMTMRTRHMPKPMTGYVMETPTRKFENVPLTILISEKTFSAGEAFAYLLQQYGRAKVVGAKTRGGGRPNRFVDIGGGYTVSVSIGTVTHPKTRTGWQSTGVIPDVAVPAEQALEAALKAVPARSARSQG
ncbi:MAG TPA: S41 family peptidase [Thermoanaerobaculia bacterium]|jgi:C-terminal processing protease CtpA/Prc